jgi:RNA polymerase sigma-70 factor (ECF subfamily)
VTYLPVKDPKVEPDPRRHGTSLRSAGNTQSMGLLGHTARTDADWIEASLGDPQAFAVLFERHGGSVHRYAIRRVGLAAAEDLVGETFAVAFRSRSNYDLSRIDARPWLFGIATNLAHHHWRSEERRSRREAAALLDDHSISDPSEEASDNEFFRAHAEQLAVALSQIDDSHLDVLLLIAGPGFSYEEVAAALEIPIGTVRSRLSRARSTLRELLGDVGQYLDEEPSTEHPPAFTEGPA